MANRISWLNSTTGLGFTELRDLVFTPGGFEIANSLFWGNGVETGTLRYRDAATGEWVTEQTWMVNSGLIGTGAPQEVFYRDMPGVVFKGPFPTDAGTGDFTGILGGAVNDNTIFGYARLFGIDTPELRWDNTAENADEATARAEFAANAAAAAADYRAQIVALLDVPIRGRIDSGFGFGGTMQMHFTPDANTTATYADFLGLIQDLPGGQTYLIGGALDGFNNPADAFGSGETVEVVLTRYNDLIVGDDFSAGTLSINAAGGNDDVLLFLNDGGAQPDLLILRGGAGNDRLETGALFDTQIDGGTGNDRIRLTYLTSAPAGTQHTLSGGDGRDQIGGARNGTNLIFGGNGRDELVGGNLADTIHGGDQADGMAGFEGDDLLYGDAGQDSLFGGDGQDTLDGGAGNDFLYGDAGVDTFHFGAGCGKDKIYDYEAGEIIEIDAGFWSGSVDDFIAANVHVNGNGILTIKLSATDNIRLVEGTFVPQDFTDAIVLV